MRKEGLSQKPSGEIASTSTAIYVGTELNIPAVPSPGSSAANFQPLSKFCQVQTVSPSFPSPPRKRRRPVGKTGKVMKEAYFKSIKRTEIFVTGSLDTLHNKLKFHYHNCKSNVSVSSKDARDVVRHYQLDSYLRKYQRWRYENLVKVNKITPVTSHEVRGKRRHILMQL